MARATQSARICWQRLVFAFWLKADIIKLSQMNSPCHSCIASPAVCLYRFLRQLAWQLTLSQRWSQKLQLASNLLGSLPTALSFSILLLRRCLKLHFKSEIICSQSNINNAWVVIAAAAFSFLFQISRLIKSTFSLIAAEYTFKLLLIMKARNAARVRKVAVVFECMARLRNAQS